MTAPMWNDHGTARRWVALPGTTSVTDFGDQKRPIPGNAPWQKFRLHFPKDAVLVRTASLDLEQGNPATRRPVETQLLHFDGAYWNAYTFAWRDDGTDADLVPAEPFARAQRNSGCVGIDSTQPCMNTPFSRLNILSAKLSTCLAASS